MDSLRPKGHLDMPGSTRDHHGLSQQRAKHGTPSLDFEFFNIFLFYHASIVLMINIDYHCYHGSISLSDIFFVRHQLRQVKGVLLCFCLHSRQNSIFESKTYLLRPPAPSPDRQLRGCPLGYELTIWLCNFYSAGTTSIQRTLNLQENIETCYRRVRAHK